MFLKNVSILAAALAALLILSGSGPTLAKSTCDLGSPFGPVDTNQDGKLSKEEYMAGWTSKDKASKNFDALDQDGDGVLTEADRQALMKKIDTNQDGKIGLEEYLALSPKKKEAQDEFKRLDLNRDGYVSDEETMGRWPTITVFTW